MNKLFIIVILFLSSFGIFSCSGAIDKVDFEESSPLFDNLPEMNRLKISPNTNDIKTEDLSVPDTLTPGKALALALLKNANLSAFSLETRSREALILQAGLYPNPEIGVEFENFAGSGDFNGINQMESTISIGQLIPLAGKLSKAEKVAVLDTKLANWDYQIAKLNLYTDVLKAYNELLLAQKKLKLDRDLVTVSEELLEKVKYRAASGATSPAEISRAEVELAKAKIALQKSVQNLEIKKYLLASYWNSKKPNFKHAKGTQEILSYFPDPDSLRVQISNNPLLRKFATQYAKRSAELELEKAYAIPDITLGIGVRHLSETADNAFVTGLSIPIPLFNRNQGNIEAAKARLRQAEMEKVYAGIELNSRFQASYYKLLALHNEITYLENKGIPEAKKAWEIITKGYRKGKFRIIDILDAQRSLYMMKKRFLEAKNSYQISLNEIEALVGFSLKKSNR